MNLGTTGKTTCFVICSIGAKDSEIRQNADDLLELIIKPALEIYPDMSVMRGDHHAEANAIDVDVIKSIQEAELCIADISEPNPNVYYEIGRRDETGKPLILVKRAGSMDLPVDIATRRYIEYDLDSRYGVREAVTQIRNFVEPLAEAGFQGSNGGASLSEIALAITRLERKIDKIQTGSVSAATHIAAPSSGISSDLEPIQEFKLARSKQDIPMLEHAMSRLQYTMDKIKFLDQIVEIAAGVGSEVAGKMLIENLQSFMDNNETTYRQKIEYIGSLISYVSKRDQEGDIQPILEQTVFPQIEALAEHQEPKAASDIYNQENRLYFGLYCNTRDESFLQKAIAALKKALSMYEAGYLYFNLASCARHIDLEVAKGYIDRCLEMEKDNQKQDVDHHVLALKIYYALQDPDYEKIYEGLVQLNPSRAEYEMMMLREGRN